MSMTPAHQRPDSTTDDTAPSPGERRPPKSQPPPRRPLRWPVLVLPFLLIIGGGVARLIDDARHEVTGTVLDHLGQPVPGVRIAVPDLNLNTLTDDDGRFSLYTPGPPQEVSLLASAVGFAPTRHSVRSGASRLDLRLRPR
jgi:hypothetical protein